MTSSPEPDWDAVDAVAAALSDKLQSPSALARKAKVSTAQAHAAIRWLKAERMLVAEGNGAWEKYRERQFGELVL